MITFLNVTLSKHINEDIMCKNPSFKGKSVKLNWV